MQTFGEIIKGNKPVLVDFYATWCGPCKMMTPILQDLKKAVGEEVTILKIDVDKHPEAAQSLGIQGVPTLIIFQDGEIKWRASGVVNTNGLKQALQPYMAA